jgi:glycine/D-amino acid oxidase-like deaminating enzyme
MTFPINDQSPVEHNAALPPEADAVVIGGGIIGVMTAWELAKAGLKTVLLEKGRVAGEQS